ncbi:deubiquitinating enzyme [Balamuthia mandrillaris]
MADGKITIQVKWSKEQHQVEIDPSETGLTLKSQLYALTGVPPDRQKWMGVKAIKTGVLGDDVELGTLGFKQGQRVMLMGTAGELPKEPVKTVFVEDLSAVDMSKLVEPTHPPGLHNLGNTCYLNATLQCLRSIPELNTSLTSFSGAVTEYQDRDTNLTAGLRDLFKMLNTHHDTVLPMAFVERFRQDFPQFAERTEYGWAQQDADECCGQVLRSLSQKLPPLSLLSSASSSTSSSPSSGNSLVNQLFSGEMKVRMKCIEEGGEAEEPTEQYVPFLKLSCYIGSQTNFMLTGLKESMKEPLHKNSPILGRDALYEKQQEISSLPYYLTVQFVRFHWKKGKDVKAKVLRPVEFPFVLDVFDLCSEELKKKLEVNRKILVARDEARTNLQLARKDKEKDGMDIDEDKKKEEEASLPPLWDQQPMKNETGFYELFAVLTHKGRSADSGHYVGWVKQGEDHWLCYDDEKVTDCRNDDITKLVGKGGADWHMAYICFYRTKPVQ